MLQLNINLNGNVVEELSTIVHLTKAVTTSKRLCARLLDVIPRQMFDIAIQAVVNGKIVARETLKAYRKDVTAKLVRILSLYRICIFLLQFLLFLVRRRCHQENEAVSQTIRWEEKDEIGWKNFVTARYFHTSS